MKQKIEHQIQNMFESEFSTYIHECGKDLPVPPHFHKSYEIITVINGSCKCILNGIEYILSEKDSIFICPFDIHSFSLDENSSVRRMTFHEHLILTVSQTINGRRPNSPVFHANEENTEFFLNLSEALFGKEKEQFARIEPYSRRIKTKALLYLLCGDFLSSAELISSPKTDNISIAYLKKESGDL